MMMIILFSILVFMLNNIGKFYMQLMLQNLLFIYMFYILLKFSLNSMVLFMELYYNMAMDYYSWGLIMLSVWVSAMMVMVKENWEDKLYMYFMYLIFLIMIFLIMSFYCMNIMWFYIYFESSLIPMFLLILGWGYQINRIQAGLYMMLYTLVGSLPLLLMIFCWYKINFSMDMNIYYNNCMSLIFFIMMILGFLIKMPMYFLHLWLPKAHVEAPVMGSMMLAGVMLKLGSYGLLRILFMMSMNYSYYKYFVVLGIMGGIYSSLICLNQIDMKMLVAYSSIVHMSMLMSGMFTMMSLSYLGGYIMMIGHGLCSSGMFFLVNINYNRLQSRSLYINKGMINYLPSLSLMWFLLISSNLSFPPSLNLFSEVFLIMSLISWMENLYFMLFIFMFFSALYSLFMYSYSQQGKFIKLNYFMSIKLNELLILLLHWIPMNMMFMMLYIFN